MLQPKLSSGYHVLLVICLALSQLLTLTTSVSISVSAVNHKQEQVSNPSHSTKVTDCLTDKGFGLSLTDKNKLLQLQTNNMEISCHAATGKVRFVGVTNLGTVIPSPNLAKQASPEENARSFLTTYSSLFGLRNQVAELTFQKLIPAPETGANFVRFQQVYHNIPIMGGEITVQVAADGQIRTVAGELLPNLNLTTTPGIPNSQAEQIAKSALAKYYNLKETDLQVGQTQLWIYNSGLLNSQPAPASSLVWRTNVVSKPATNQKEPLDYLVLIDAQTGSLLLHFNQLETARDRRICDNNNNEVAYATLQGCLAPVRVEGSPASGNPEVDKAYDFLGDTYNFYKNQYNRDSLDGKGLPIQATVKICLIEYDCPFYNAFWHRQLQQMFFGQNFVVDDVVGHELTHGFTQATSGLYYYSQSGAINESLSDIFGEFIDQTNADDGAAGSNPNLRWLLAEDLKLNGIRNMQNPPFFGDPDRVGSIYYYTGEADSAGVHYNSGVSNKAAYLLTDGGSFNNYSINPVGLAKTGQIYYQAATKYLTSASDYQDLHDYLIQGCQDLIGQHAISSTDCEEVKKVVAATEMSLRLSVYPAKAPVCENNIVPSDIFYDSFEALDVPGWETASTSPTGGWFQAEGYFTHGKAGLYLQVIDKAADSTITLRKGIKIPPGAYLHFKHFHNLEKGSSPGSVTAYDGGMLEYSEDGGQTWQLTDNMFTHGGYNKVIHSEYDNPLKGRRAFGGNSLLYYSSRLDLNSLKDKTIQFRFRGGSDKDTASWGWVIDEFRIYTCPQPPLALTSSSNPATAGENVTFTATVATTTPGNWVTFTNSSGAGVASVPLVNGTATYTTNTLPPGVHLLKASYTGGSNQTQVATLAQVIKENNTQLTTLDLTSSPNPSLIGQPFQLTANISISPLTATGTITFSQLPTGTILGSASLNAGSAVLDVPAGQWGHYEIQAYYAGNSNLSAAASNRVTHEVCNPLIVTRLTDDGSAVTCGTFSHALTQAGTNGTATIAFALTAGNTVTFTGPLASALQSGVTVAGHLNCTNNPLLQINGNGQAGSLELVGNNLLRGLAIYGFNGPQLKVKPGSSGNSLQCTRVHQINNP